MRVILLSLLLAGCTSTTTTGDDDVMVPDAEPGTVGCDTTAAFSAPVAVGGLDTAAEELGARFSPDERTVYFHRFTGAEDHDLFSATRADASAAFGTATVLTALNLGSADENSPSVTADGLDMVFSSDRGGTFDLFAADRDATADEFMVVSQIASINSGFDDTTPFVSRDGSDLWFSSTRDGNADLYRATVSGSSFGNAALVAELNTAGAETDPVLSDDDREIFFARGGAVFRGSRAGGSGAFSGIAEVTELGDGSPLWLSAGGCRLYLSSARGGDADIFVAERPQL